MKIAIDSSILIGVLKGDPSFEVWRELLIEKRVSGDELIICDVAYAEISHAYSYHWQAAKDLHDLEIQYDEIRREAAYEAGVMYRAYRSNGGTKARVLPDFLIGAHALKQADGLASSDDGYLRAYFAGLTRIKP